MTDTEVLQPDPGSLRAGAEAAELAQAVSGLVSIDGCRLADSDRLAPLARDIARSYDRGGPDRAPLCTVRPALPARRSVPAAGPGGIQGWPQRDRGVLDHAQTAAGLDRYGTYTGTQQAMNSALSDILAAFGYTAEPFGSGGAWLVTGRRDRDAEAGR